MLCLLLFNACASHIVLHCDAEKHKTKSSSPQNPLRDIKTSAGKPKLRGRATAICGGAFLGDSAFLLPRDQSPMTRLDLTSPDSSPLNRYDHSPFLNLRALNLRLRSLIYYFDFRCIASLKFNPVLADLCRIYMCIFLYLFCLAVEN